MTYQSVTSSNIRAVKHEDGDLYIKFVSGHIYRYEGVSEELYGELLSSASIGKFFHSHIKNQFPGVMIE